MANPKGSAPAVQVRDSFGGTRNLQVDTNRPSLAEESLFRFANAIALPSYGIYSDILTWILTPATVCRLLQTLAGSGVITATAGVSLSVFLLAPVVLMLLIVLQQAPGTHGIPAVFRFLLILLGLFLALDI